MGDAVELMPAERPLQIVVGSGGVGKTTVAAALGVEAARRGERTLVMTFDPSHRLKSTLGLGELDTDVEAGVELEAPGTLHASLLDAKATFDRLVDRYAPDAEARERILGNRFYRDLAGSLAGILEYMAVERLYEVREAGRYDRVILDTPPTRQAIDFLEAPERIVAFLDSGALRVALRPWFDADGSLRTGRGWGRFGRGLEGWLDKIVGLDLLRQMAEFFQAFAPLFAGFRGRAVAVQELLRSRETSFLLVSGPSEERVPDALFFARKLLDSGYELGGVVVNRVHPLPSPPPDGDPRVDGRALLAWLARRDRAGVESLRGLLGEGRPPLEIPLLPFAPTGLAALSELAERLVATARGAG